jgi:hypothetical protein
VDASIKHTVTHCSHIIYHDAWHTTLESHLPALCTAAGPDVCGPSADSIMPSYSV